MRSGIEQFAPGEGPFAQNAARIQQVRLLGTGAS